MGLGSGYSPTGGKGVLTLLEAKDFLIFKGAGCLCQLPGPLPPQKVCLAAADLNVQIKVLNGCLLISLGLILPSARSLPCQVSTLKCENSANLPLVPRFARSNFRRQLNSSALV